jgi:hypothetical protein
MLMRLVSLIEVARAKASPVMYECTLQDAGPLNSGMPMMRQFRSGFCAQHEHTGVIDGRNVNRTIFDARSNPPPTPHLIAAQRLGPLIARFSRYDRFWLNLIKTPQQPRQGAVAHSDRFDLVE